MHVNSTSPLSGLKPIAATCLFSLFLAGCGGGGGGGSSSSLTSEQQTALAAKTAAGTAQFAQSFAQSQTEDSDSGGGGTSARTSDSRVTRGTSSSTCTVSGELHSYDNDVANDTELDFDIEGAAFPALFTNSLGEAEGVPEYYQVRSDCVDNGVEIVGSADVAVLQYGGNADLTALAYRAGGFPGNYTPTSAVDTDASLDIKTDFSGFFSDLSFRGVMHVCNGCVDANLANFTGTPDIDVAASAWLEMGLDFGDGRSTFVLGDDAADRFTLVSTDQGGGIAAVDVNGRLAVDNPGNECDFDVTYTTVRDLRITDFSSTATQTVDGELGVTNNDTGDSFTVTFDSSGNVYVDGEPVDIEDEEDACTLSSAAA